MLTASWLVCRWCVGGLNEANCAGSIIDGLVGFLVLMSTEVGLGVVFSRSLVDQLTAHKLAPGAIGLGAQVIFALFPVIQVWRR